MIGQRFGKLTVVERTPAKGRVMWKCRCDCGNETITRGTKLRLGKAKSCGCGRSEGISKANKTHGMTGTTTWVIWRAMKARCSNPNYKHYYRYGGRGIKVCERWENSFENFYEDMGERPLGMSIDRIDNDGNYEPGNCKWSTAKEQANNTRSSVVVIHDGNKLTVSEVADMLGLTRSKVYAMAKKENMLFKTH